METVKERRPRRRLEGSLSFAQQELVTAHLYLARPLAMRHFRRNQYMGFEDCYSVALFGLTYAAAMWHEAKGVPFGAYATMVMKHRMIQESQSIYRRLHLSAIGHGVTQADILMVVDRPHHNAHVFEVLERIKQILLPRWFDAVYMRYALGMTLEEIGAKLGVTRERVRQLETKACDRVRRHFQLQQDGSITSLLERSDRGG